MFFEMPLRYGGHLSQKLKKEERYGRRTEKICEIFLLSEKSS